MCALRVCVYLVGLVVLIQIGVVEVLPQPMPLEKSEQRPVAGGKAWAFVNFRAARACAHANKKAKVAINFRGGTGCDGCIDRGASVVQRMWELPRFLGIGCSRSICEPSDRRRLKKPFPCACEKHLYASHRSSRNSTTRSFPARSHPRAVALSNGVCPRSSWASRSAPCFTRTSATLQRKRDTKVSHQTTHTLDPLEPSAAGHRATLRD